MSGNLSRLAIVGDQAAGTPVGALRSHVLVLGLVSPLHDRLRVEVGRCGVVAVLVDRQPQRELTQRLEVPGPLLAVEDIRIAIRVRRILEIRLIEHVALVVQHRREDGEGQALEAELIAPIEVDGAFRELREVVPRRVHEGLKVEPLALEGRGTADPGRSHDVGRIRGVELDGEDVVRLLVLDNLERHLNVRVRLVERIDDPLLDFNLGRVVARAEAAEPTDLDWLAGDGLVALGGRLASARSLRLPLRPACGEDEGQDREQRAEAKDGATHLLLPPSGLTTTLSGEVSFQARPSSPSALGGASRRPTPATAARMGSALLSQCARTTSRSR